MKNTIFEIILTIIPLIVTAITILIWYLKGYDEKLKTKGYLYHPPKGLNTLEVGYIYKGEVKEKDINSLLLYLASKKYLKIVEIKDSFSIIKLKDYKGNNKILKLFFDNLFNGKTEIVEDELYDSFYKTTDSIRHNINKKINTTYFFNNRFYMNVIDILTVLSMFCIVTINYLEHAGRDINFWLVSIFMLFYILTCMPFKTMNSITKFVNRIFILVSFFFILVVGFDITKPEFLLNNFLYLLLIAVCNTVVLFMPKRNMEGNKILGQIKRFRNSIKYIDESKLKDLIKEDKDYVANIFPYAYTLGVTRNLIKVAEDIEANKPKYLEQIDKEVTLRDSYKFLKKVTGNLDRRYGDDYY